MLLGCGGLGGFVRWCYGEPWLWCLGVNLRVRLLCCRCGYGWFLLAGSGYGWRAGARILARPLVWGGLECSCRGRGMCRVHSRIWGWVGEQRLVDISSIGRRVGAWELEFWELVLLAYVVV